LVKKNAWIVGGWAFDIGYAMPPVTPVSIAFSFTEAARNEQRSPDFNPAPILEDCITPDRFDSAAPAPRDQN
jgi:hypothetical protein